MELLVIVSRPGSSTSGIEMERRVRSGCKGWIVSGTA